MGSEKKFDVFISYAHVDRVWVIRLKDSLEEHGIRVWIDDNEIRPGDLFAKAIAQGIKDCHAVAIVVSKDSMESDWVEAEYHRALTLATKEKTQLIPIILRLTDVPGFLEDRKWISFQNEAEYKENVKKLIWGITGEKNTSDKKDDVLETETHSYNAIQEVKRQIVEISDVLNSGETIYNDQCQQIVKKINTLRNEIEEISSKYSKNYLSVISTSSLFSELDLILKLVTDFCGTCPPGDDDLRKQLRAHLDTIKDVEKYLQ